MLIRFSMTQHLLPPFHRLQELYHDARPVFRPGSFVCVGIPDLLIAVFGHTIGRSGHLMTLMLLGTRMLYDKTCNPKM